MQQNQTRLRQVHMETAWPMTSDKFQWSVHRPHESWTHNLVNVDNKLRWTLVTISTLVPQRIVSRTTGRQTNSTEEYRKNRKHQTNDKNLHETVCEQAGWGGSRPYERLASQWPWQLSARQTWRETGRRCRVPTCTSSPMQASSELHGLQATYITATSQVHHRELHVFL